MKTIFVCIGSSCHLKGSYDVVQALQELIEISKLESTVSIKASFCLGECTKGVSVKINDGPIIGVNKDNVTEFFDNYIINS